MRSLRYAVRQLLATPGFTAIAILIVAIGIGSSTAMFSVVDAVVVRPLALPDADRLVAVYETNLERNVPIFSVSVPNYTDFKTRATSFERMAAESWRAMNLTGTGEPQLIQVRMVTADFLATLGVRTVQGRDFRAEEDRPNGPRVAIVSERFWRRHFGGRRDVVGQGLQLDGDTYTIVGVAATSRPPLEDIDVAVPMQADVAKEDRLNHELDVIGRLKPGVSVAAADRELHAIAEQLARTYLPEAERGWRTRLVPLAEDVVGDSLRRALVVLLGAVGLLLLVACANLSNLILVRTSARAFELSVRQALGESRPRAIAQILVEVLLVTLAGGALGVAMASWSVDALRTLPIARVSEIAIDPRVLGVALAATVISGVLAGLGPALRATRVAPQDALQAHGVRVAPRSRLRDAMIVAQLALSLTLLVGAVLIARSFWGLLRVDPGFSTDGAVTLAMRPASNAQAFYRAVGERVRALPGVDAAGFISTLPLGPGGQTSNNVFAAGSRLSAGQSIQSSWRLVSGDYFGAMRIPVLRGRTLDGLTPEEARRSVVLSASLARALWGDEDPVGREVDPGANNRRLRVVGVVGDVRNLALAAEPRPAFYWSIERFVYGPMRLVVHSSRPADQIVAAVRREIRAVDPAAPIFQVSTLDAVRAESLSEERLLLRVLWAFAGTALLLAALGTFGVVAYAAQQRTREFGIRLAVGADGAHVRRLVLGQAFRLVAVGAVLGLAGALAGGRLVESLLFGITAFDVASYLLATAALALAVLVAAWWPAHRAARLDPVIALK